MKAQKRLLGALLVTLLISACGGNEANQSPIVPCTGLCSAQLGQYNFKKIGKDRDVKVFGKLMIVRTDTAAIIYKQKLTGNISVTPIVDDPILLAEFDGQEVELRVLIESKRFDRVEELVKITVSESTLCDSVCYGSDQSFDLEFRVKQLEEYNDPPPPSESL